MSSEVNTIIKIETSKSNKLFYKYFISINIFLVLLNLLFSYNTSVIGNRFNHQIVFHLFILVIFLLPIGTLFKFIDRPLIFKYVLITIYIIYIFCVIFINNFDVFNFTLLLSINSIALFYMSSKLLVLSTLMVGTLTGFFTYYFNINENALFLIINRCLIVFLISIGQWVAIDRLLKLTSDILTNTNSIFIDRLTGIYNKHYLKEKISSISYGGEVQLSIINLDIDDFKEINLKYGFNAGDTILQGFANIVQKILRNSDSICRNEGDEFVIIVQHPKEFEAEVLAERIRKTLQSEHFDIVDKENNEVKVNITASFGVVSLEENEDSDSLLMRAKHALEIAKKNGKNRIEKI